MSARQEKIDKLVRDLDGARRWRVAHLDAAQQVGEQIDVINAELEALKRPTEPRMGGSAIVFRAPLNLMLGVRRYFAVKDATGGWLVTSFQRPEMSWDEIVDAAVGEIRFADEGEVVK